MRTKNGKRLWPVPAAFTVMALAGLLAFGLMATNVRSRLLPRTTLIVHSSSITTALYPQPTSHVPQWATRLWSSSRVTLNTTKTPRCPS